MQFCSRGYWLMHVHWGQWRKSIWKWGSPQKQRLESRQEDGAEKRGVRHPLTGNFRPNSYLSFVLRRGERDVELGFGKERDIAPFSKSEGQFCWESFSWHSKKHRSCSVLNLRKFVNSAMPRTGTGQLCLAQAVWRVTTLNSALA